MELTKQLKENFMGKRYSTYLTINQPDEFVRIIVNDFFEKEGFTLKNYKGEMVWKKGTGMLAAPQFIKVDYQNGTVYLEAWMKYAIIPGVYCGEMGLTGAVACIPKSILKGRVDDLMNLLAQQVSAPVQQPQMAYAGQALNDQPAYSEQAPNQEPVAQQQPTFTPNPIPIAVHNPTGKATLSLVMGLVSIVSWLIPFAGVATTVIGIITAIPGMKSTSKGKAIAGLVLSIIFLVLSILNWIAGAFLNALSLAY